MIALQISTASLSIPSLTNNGGAQAWICFVPSGPLLYLSALSLAQSK